MSTDDSKIPKEAMTQGGRVRSEAVYGGGSGGERKQEGRNASDEDDGEGIRRA